MKELVTPIFENLNTWGLPVLTLIIGIVEFSLGLYGKHWNKNERILDLTCYFLPRVVVRPAVAYFSLALLPIVLPSLQNSFEWVPFWWGLFIIAIADDLTQYWYHRLHHELPWLWKFHRAHHSAPYMGMAMASRQNLIYTFLFSQTFVTATLVYLGLGFPALVVLGLKSIITKMAHSSIRWDRPFYQNKWLHPVAWVMERLISTPATHHAHHAAHERDGIGYYHGNFGNMFFVWDVFFGTAKITRKYPEAYGIEEYHQEEWYAQLLYPIFKSKKSESEISY